MMPDASNAILYELVGLKKNPQQPIHYSFTGTLTGPVPMGGGFDDARDEAKRERLQTIISKQQRARESEGEREEAKLERNRLMTQQRIQANRE